MKKNLFYQNYLVLFLSAYLCLPIVISDSQAVEVALETEGGGGGGGGSGPPSGSTSAPPTAAPLAPVGIDHPNPNSGVVVNPGLWECIDGELAFDCVPGPHPMVLFTKGKTLVSGLHTLKGAPCNPSVTVASKDCPVRIETSWVAVCAPGDLDPSGSGNCHKASNISVQWKIFQEFQISGVPKISAIETTNYVGGELKATELSVMHIMASAGIAQNCPAGQVVGGVTSAGQANCIRDPMLDLPPCVQTATACTGSVYPRQTDHYTLKIPVNYTKNQHYSKDACGFGSNFNRTCTANNPDCSDCQTEAVDCFTRDSNTCTPNQINKEMYTCCRPL
ncbi:MAG: hypothetical protein H7333_11835 [Bdellovibrionales bacterium]|nr:hypothetical protein [Oligoflexia bacterium]